MLTPQELLEIVDTMYPLLDELNGWITADLIRRLMARMSRGEDLTFGATDKWQLELYKAAAGHYEDLEKKIKEWTKKSDAEVRAIFEDAGIRAWSYDDAFFVAQGFESVPLLKSETLMKVLVDTYQRTNGEIHNFTRTTAKHSEQRFMNVCDKAHLKVITGAESYTQAVKEAVEELADANQMRVQYPSGHSDTIETAVLRCVRTGTAQASGNITMRGMEERDWDVILVSAHLGARYGDGGQNPGNHFWWQGKLYSRTGRTKELPDFIKNTGYGTGEGLCGWNCRHSFGPGTIGHNPYEGFDAEENKKAYDLSQKQRGMEARIRKSKNRLLGLKTAISTCTDPETKGVLQEAYNEEALKLRHQNAAYNKFCEDNDLKRYDDRLRVAKWNRSEATKAAQAAAKAESAAADARASDTFTVIPPAKGDAIKAQSVFKELQKSDVGRSAYQYIIDNKTPVEINYTKEHAPNVRGYTYGRSVFINADVTKTVKLTTKTIIHEVTHIRLGNANNSRHEEAYCMMQEALHDKEHLTFNDLRGIIKDVNKLYPELKWR